MDEKDIPWVHHSLTVPLTNILIVVLIGTTKNVKCDFKPLLTLTFK